MNIMAGCPMRIRVVFNLKMLQFPPVAMISIYKTLKVLSPSITSIHNPFILQFPSLTMLPKHIHFKYIVYLRHPYTTLHSYYLQALSVNNPFIFSVPCILARKEYYNNCHTYSRPEFVSSFCMFLTRLRRITCVIAMVPFSAGARVVFFCKTFRTDTGSNQPPVQLVCRRLLLSR